jgi:alpha-mannosidase
VDAENVVIETVKPAEDWEDGYVIRLYEAERTKTQCSLWAADAAQAYEVNILEDVLQPLPICDGKISLQLHPFEIKSVLIRRK